MTTRGGLRRLITALRNDVPKALVVAGGILVDEAQGSIMAGSMSGANHVPSQPFEPPNNDTRVLHDSIEVLQHSPLRVTVEAKAPYARYLEYGTSRMSPRPYMGPALAKTRDEINATLNAAVRNAVRKANGS